MLRRNLVTVNDGKIENTVLKNLIHDDAYMRKVLPFIKNEYFERRSDQILFETISSFITKYDSLPTKEVLTIEFDKRDDISQQEHGELTQTVGELNESPSDHDWLVDTTEKCRDRAIYLALMESIALAGMRTEKGRDSIPSIC